MCTFLLGSAFFAVNRMTLVLAWQPAAFCICCILQLLQFTAQHTTSKPCFGDAGQLAGAIVRFCACRIICTCSFMFSSNGCLCCVVTLLLFWVQDCSSCCLVCSKLACKLGLGPTMPCAQPTSCSTTGSNDCCTVHLPVCCGYYQCQALKEVVLFGPDCECNTPMC